MVIGGPPPKALQLTGYRSFQSTLGIIWALRSTRGGGPAAERLVRWAATREGQPAASQRSDGRFFSCAHSRRYRLISVW